jgi:hypothetical protein
VQGSLKRLKSDQRNGCAWCLAVLALVVFCEKLVSAQTVQKQFAYGLVLASVKVIAQSNLVVGKWPTLFPSALSRQHLDFVFDETADFGCLRPHSSIAFGASVHYFCLNRACGLPPYSLYPMRVAAEDLVEVTLWMIRVDARKKFRIRWLLIVHRGLVRRVESYDGWKADEMPLCSHHQTVFSFAFHCR